MRSRQAGQGIYPGVALQVQLQLVAASPLRGARPAAARGHRPGARDAECGGRHHGPRSGGGGLLPGRQGPPEHPAERLQRAALGGARARAACGRGGHHHLHGAQPRRRRGGLLGSALLKAPRQRRGVEPGMSTRGEVLHLRRPGPLLPRGVPKPARSHHLRLPRLRRRPALELQPRPRAARQGHGRLRGCAGQARTKTQPLEALPRRPLLPRAARRCVGGAGAGGPCAAHQPRRWEAVGLGPLPTQVRGSSERSIGPLRGHRCAPLRRGTGS
mmetsp:Transcript_21949/g.44404  ORF Transcript_21949/g.44404 Transcript_21949/m.44404 type:complete len:272 (-) Transcript_21949:96-911(-)